MASRMLSDVELEETLRLPQDAELDVALSPELEEMLDWLEGTDRSLQEVADQMRLLGDGERDVILDHLEVSAQYGSTFVRELGGAETRFRNRRSRPKQDPAKVRREVPEGFQKVLVNITRLQGLGRNVFALTPERLPEDVLRLWPAGRPLPELVVVNMDHEVPRVSVVRRLPSAGGIKIQRGALKSMTGVVAKVLGKPEVLRQTAVKEGLLVEHPFDRVDVSLTEIAWSPQLELGELLYDWEEVRLDEDEEQEAARAEEMEEARGVTDAAASRLTHNADLVEDLDERLHGLRAGWGEHGGAEAKDAEERLKGLEDRRGKVDRQLLELDRQRLLLATDLGKTQVDDLDARIQGFEDRMEEMEEETAALARQVTDEERALESHRRQVEEQRLARVAEREEEEEAEEGRRIDKAMADPADKDREQESRRG